MQLAELWAMTNGLLDDVKPNAIGAFEQRLRAHADAFTYLEPRLRASSGLDAELHRAPPQAPAPVSVKPASDLPRFTTHLLTEHLLVKLYQIVIESAMSEQLARVYTMRLATENARKLVEKLTLDYNLARSHAVTQSLLEIVAGYAATKQPVSKTDYP